MDVISFTEKLNKIDGNVYVIEEEVYPTNGIYEAELKHDNINTDTLVAYTGPKLTGERIQSYAVSTPSMAPWKRIIRLYTDAPIVYISYETIGDTVEAEDINQLQDVLVDTQIALNAEVVRASTKEDELQRDIDTEKARAEAVEEDIQNMIHINKPNWDDKYTKNEVDNKFSVLETSIDWKEAVDTYEQLDNMYPSPEDGWTVNVKDTDYTYRWSGTEWIVISANAIPKATENVDGLLSKEDKTAYDDAYHKRHVHVNKVILDEITQALIDRWNSALTELPSHTHLKNQITDFPESLKNPNSLTILFNGSNQEKYDGSVEKSINIAPDEIGAAVKEHNHDSIYLKKNAVTWKDLRGG